MKSYIKNSGNIFKKIFIIYIYIAYCLAFWFSIQVSFGKAQVGAYFVQWQQAVRQFHLQTAVELFTQYSAWLL